MSTITPTAFPAITTSVQPVEMEFEYTDDVQMEDVFPVYMEFEYTDDDIEMEDVFPVDMEIDDVDMVDPMDEMLSLFYYMTLS